jgi:hypothetical protein
VAGRLQPPAFLTYDRFAENSAPLRLPQIKNDSVMLAIYRRIVALPSPSAARTLLQEFICQPGHQFWDDTISLVDSRKFPTLPGSKNLTDYYLLALAIKNGGKLVTFDQRIEPGLLQGGISSYHVIQDNLGE